MKNSTKSIAVAIAIFAATTAAAGAADINGGMKDQPAYQVPETAKNWDGFYIGIEAGGGAAVFDAARTLEHEADVWKEHYTKNDDGSFTLDDKGHQILGSLTDHNDRKTDLGLDGLFGGVNLEYKKQLSHDVVVGVFGNFDLGSMKGSDHYSRTVSLDIDNQGADLYEEHGNLSVEKKWNGDLGFKLGILATPNTLIYGSIAASFARFNIKGNSDLTLLPGQNIGGFNNPFPASAYSDDTTKIGPKFGLGIETRLGGNWLFGVEGDYAHYGSFGSGDKHSKNLVNSGDPNECGNVFGIDTSTDEDVHGSLNEWTAKAKLTYQIQ